MGGWGGSGGLEWVVEWRGRASETRVRPAPACHLQLRRPHSAGCNERASDAGTLTLASPVVGEARERVLRARGSQLPRWLLIRTTAAFLDAGGSAFTFALLS